MSSDFHSFMGILNRVRNIVFGYKPRGKGKKKNRRIAIK